MRVALCFCMTKTPGRAAPEPIGSGVRSGERLRRYSSRKLDIPSATLSSAAHETTRFGDHFLRAGLHPGEAFFGDGGLRRYLLQPAARDRVLAGEAPVQRPG